MVEHGSSGGSIPNMGKWEVGLGGTRTREGAAEFSTNPHCYIWAPGGILAVISLSELFPFVKLLIS